jgi:hypothetical protein
VSSESHIANAEAKFRVLSVTPDFCKVGKSIVAFDCMQLLAPEKIGYAKSVTAREQKILLKGSVINGVKGNAGSGVQSGVSGANGHVKVLAGSGTVFIEGREAARDGDLCAMNGAA